VTARGLASRAARPIGSRVAAVLVHRLQQSDLRAGAVVLYHRLAAHSRRGELELTPPIPAETFEAQLHFLKSQYRLVPTSELPQSVAARERGAPFPVALTFDDDLQSHVRIAAPILHKLGLPAAFFLCGASLHAPFAFWWERLQSAAERKLLELLPPPLEDRRRGRIRSARSLRRLAEQCEELEPAEQDALAERLRELLGPDPPNAGIRADEVRELVEEGFEIGFHTLRHQRLPPLNAPSLAEALREGRPALEAAAGLPVTMIAYPHGRADERVAAAARDAGFVLGFTGRAEAVAPASDPLLLGRVEAPHSRGGLALELALALRRAAGRSA
jgi:peptidoglycan/xylan/chitin deacetylase (PgdA/CDA1 family)